MLHSKDTFSLINFYVEQGSNSIFLFHSDTGLFTLCNSNVNVLLHEKKIQKKPKVTLFLFVISKFWFIVGFI